jgi:hypothetical protein
MKDFDIMAHLGISKGKPKSIAKLTDDFSQLTDDSLLSTGNSLTQNPATEPVCLKASELVDKSSEKHCTEQSALFDAAEYGSISTSPLAADRSGDAGWDDLPAPKPPDIDRQLGETVLIFSRKAIAAEWESYLNVTLGVNAWKPRKVVVIGGRNTWQVRVINLTPAQIGQLEKIDTNSTPPRMPIWNR